MINAITLPEVFAVKGKAFTTSKAVADYFGKRHDNILRDIEKLECSDEFRLLNFEETYTYRENPNGGKRIRSLMIRMTRDGFTFLAMGFTGKKAARFKEAYIARFNSMENWIVNRENLKQDQNALGLAIQKYELISGKSDPYAYSRENNLLYIAAIGASKKKWLSDNGFPASDDIRQHLSEDEINLLDHLLKQNAMMIELFMTYAERKAALIQQAERYRQIYFHQDN
ncbi:Rha family transcriptional regulator [Testudinibacter sp. TR-2022]|uniref:Rha family transcriptional regulator n=1 Tax=Testudinibacter sp. TR-2022 TaxID=2585029 RepID=UPI001119FBBC|nr:Rha family transcriptional regulator [Testudinibacter sp. TR-2022]TNH03479.1 Rha family transcriptional regulator [Pasteurellaceae bacterium Phil31]TNH07948.1 Rha family transcriptional regulator [Testudinibacter sp. TR-2022]TNH10315.1 Rha family transcriptional regulator [Testudinibacter sp. TR-2022]